VYGFHVQIDPRAPCTNKGLGDLMPNGTGGGNEYLLLKPMGIAKLGELFQEAIHQSSPPGKQHIVYYGIRNA